jgi:hypothetical protein
VSVANRLPITSRWTMPLLQGMIFSTKFSGIVHPDFPVLLAWSSQMILFVYYETILADNGYINIFF